MTALTDADLARLARFERLAMADPDNAALLADAFDAAMGARALDVANGFLERLAAVDSNAPQTLFRRGRWLLASGSHDEARAAFHIVRARVGPNPAIDSQLAAASSAAGDHKAAVELLLPHARQRQLSGAAWALLLSGLHREQRFDEARALIQSHGDAFSSDAAGLGAASLVSLDAGDIEAAAEFAAQALARNGAQVDALVVAGFAALNDSDGARAAACLTEATTLRPEEPRAWSGLGFAKLFVGELAAAQAAFERSTALNPAHAGTWHGLAWSRIAAGDVPGAKAAFEGALESDRNFAETHGGLALVAHMQGDNAAAEQSLARALKLDRRSPTARYAQAMMRGARIDGDAEMAVRHILEAPAERNARVVGQALFGLARRAGKPLS